jgi:hypothetical protein
VVDRREISDTGGHTRTAGTRNAGVRIVWAFSLAPRDCPPVASDVISKFFSILLGLDLPQRLRVPPLVAQMTEV